MAVKTPIMKNSSSRSARRTPRAARARAGDSPRRRSRCRSCSTRPGSRPATRTTAIATSTSAMPSTPKEVHAEALIQTQSCRELEPGGAGPVSKREADDGEATTSAARRPARPAWPAGLRLRQREDDQRADQRDAATKDRPGEAVHARSLEPHHASSSDDGDGAAEHGQRVGAHEPGLGSSQSAEPPPKPAARPFTAPSTPRLSKNTSARVSHCPGRISTASLNASA